MLPVVSINLWEKNTKYFCRISKTCFTYKLFLLIELYMPHSDQTIWSRTDRNQNLRVSREVNLLHQEFWWCESFHSSSRVDRVDKGHRCKEKKDFLSTAEHRDLRLKDSVSIVLYENCPISPVSPTKPNKHPAIADTKCRKFKKDEGKRTAGTVCVQIQEMPAFSYKCCSCIKHFPLATTVFCMTTNTQTHTHTHTHLQWRQKQAPERNHNFLSSWL